MAAKQNFNSDFDESIWNRSCKQEIVNPISGKLSGTIPTWLNGVLIRNGPGLFEFGDTTLKHLFDGMALLHRFEIREGVATYQCRFLNSDIYQKNKEQNRVAVTDFGTTSVPDPCRTIFQRISSAFSLNNDVPDNAAISVYPFGDEIYTFAETGVMYRVDGNNLETIRKGDLTKSLSIVTHTSHPHVTSDGTVYNLALSCTGRGPLYHIVCFPSKPQDMDEYSILDKAHVIADIAPRWPLHPSYMHTFGITKNYFLIVEQPFSIGILKVFIHKVLNRPAHQLTDWNYNETTKINVVSRKNHEVVYSFHAKGFFYFHIINQYEHLNHIVLDVCAYQDSSVINSMYLEAIKNPCNNTEKVRSIPQRFVLPLCEVGTCPVNKNLVNLQNTSAKTYVLEDGRVFAEPEAVCETHCDLPSIYYEKFIGRKYKYFYAISYMDSIHTDVIIKVDVNEKSTKVWAEKDCFPSEPIFVPAPSAKGEDDGIILSSLTYKQNEHYVSLLVLEATTLTELGRVDFETLSAVPKTFHGWYFSQNQLKNK